MLKLTLAMIMVGLTLNANASSKVFQTLNCTMQKNSSKPKLLAPQHLTVAMTEDGFGDKLAVNEKTWRFTDEELDENIDTLTFKFGASKVQATFTFGQCETTKKGSVSAEIVSADKKVEFSGTQNLTYICNCAM